MKELISLTVWSPCADVLEPSHHRSHGLAEQWWEEDKTAFCFWYFQSICCRMAFSLKIKKNKKLKKCAVQVNKLPSIACPFWTLLVTSFSVVISSLYNFCSLYQWWHCWQGSCYEIKTYFSLGISACKSSSFLDLVKHLYSAFIFLTSVNNNGSN